MPISIAKISIARRQFLSSIKAILSSRNAILSSVKVNTGIKIIKNKIKAPPQQRRSIIANQRKHDKQFAQYFCVNYYQDIERTTKISRRKK